VSFSGTFTGAGNPPPQAFTLMNTALITGHDDDIVYSVA
jgi:hypothetical protein